MEDIWRREGLTLAEDEIKAEYDAVMREAQEGDQKLDEEKLQEQVIESLKVGLRAKSVTQSNIGFPYVE